MVYVTPGMVVEVVRFCYVGVSGISVCCLNVDIIDALAIVYYVGLRCDVWYSTFVMLPMEQQGQTCDHEQLSHWFVEMDRIEKSIPTTLFTV
jgi:hypothetical protein